MLADAAAVPVRNLEGWWLVAAGVAATAGGVLVFSPSWRWAARLGDEGEAVDARPWLALPAAVALAVVVVLAARAVPQRARWAAWVVAGGMGVIELAAAIRIMVTNWGASTEFVRLSVTAGTWMAAVAGLVLCACGVAALARPARRRVAPTVVAVAVAVALAAVTAPRAQLELAAPSVAGARLLNPEPTDQFPTSIELERANLDRGVVAMTDERAVVVATRFGGGLTIVDRDGRVYDDLFDLADVGPAGLAGHLTDAPLGATSTHLDLDLAPAPAGGVLVAVASGVVEVNGSAGGRLVVATSGDRTDVSLADLESRGVSVVPGTQVHAVARGPGGRLALLAVLTDGGVSVVEPGVVEPAEHYDLAGADTELEVLRYDLAVGGDGTIAIVFGCQLFVIPPDGRLEQRGRGSAGCEGAPALAASSNGRLWLLAPAGQEVRPLPGPGEALPAQFWAEGEASLAGGPDGLLLALVDTQLFSVNPGETGVSW